MWSIFQIFSKHVIVFVIYGTLRALKLFYCCNLVYCKKAKVCTASKTSTEFRAHNELQIWQVLFLGSIIERADDRADRYGTYTTWHVVDHVRSLLLPILQGRNFTFDYRSRFSIKWSFFNSVSKSCLSFMRFCHIPYVVSKEINRYLLTRKLLLIIFLNICQSLSYPLSMYDFLKRL